MSTTLKAIRSAVAAVQWASPTVAGILAERLFCTPMRRPAPKRERVLVADAEPVRIPFGGEDLVGWAWGSGPTVLLVHGWDGRGAQLGALVEPLVAAGMRVVTYDAPGHGASAGTVSTLDLFARAIAAAAEAVGPLHAIVAHSFGAAATSVAMSRGVRAERVVYLAPFARVEEGVDRFVRAIGLSPDAREVFLDRLASRNCATVVELEPCALAPRFRTPLLVVHDDADREVPFDDGAAITGAWPGARLVKTSGLGHRRILRDAGVVATVVSDVLEGATTRTPLEILEDELFHQDGRLARS